MSLEVTCPGCGSPLKARDTMIGKKARCKKCQTSFRIPGQSATDSLGDSQALSVIGVPAPPLPDEPVPLAAAIDDFDFPVPFEKSPPSQPQSAPLKSSSTKPARPVKVPAPPPPTPVKDVLSLDDEAESDSPPASAPAASDDPFAFDSGPAPEEPKSRIRKKSKEHEETEEKPRPSKKKQPVDEAASEDPFATPFESAAAATVSESSDASAADPFSFNADAPPQPKPARMKDRTEEPEGKPSKKKAKARGDAAAALGGLAPEPAAAGDPFSFGDAAPAAVPPRAGSEDDEEIDGEAEDDSPRGKRQYGKRGEKKSNPMLLIAMVGGVLALGAAITGVVLFFNKKQPEPTKKSTDKTEEVVAPATPPTESPKDEPKTKKDAGKKDNSKKDPGDSPRKDPREKSPPNPSGMTGSIKLDSSLKTFSLRLPNNKLQLVQKPSTTNPNIAVDVPFEKVKRFFPAGNRLQDDVVVVWQSNPAFMGSGERLSVNTYSGSTGFKAGSFEFDGDGKDLKCDASADGKTFIIALDGKVTIWNLTDKTRPLEAFDPYAEKDKEVHKKAGLAAVYFPANAAAASNPTNFITVSTAGAIHLFDIATKKSVAEYIPKGGAPDRVMQTRNVAIDTDRLFLVVAVGGSIHQVKTSDLSPVGELSIAGEASRSFGIAVAAGRFAYAFEADADKKTDRAILLCLPNGGPTIFRWPDAAGEPVNVNWAGPENIIVGTTTGAVWCEYDSEDKLFRPLAMLKPSTGKSMHETTERSDWYLVPNPTDATKSILVEITMPLDDVMEIRQGVGKKLQLETLPFDDKGVSR